MRLCSDFLWSSPLSSLLLAWFLVSLPSWLQRGCCSSRDDTPIENDLEAQKELAGLFLFLGVRDFPQNSPGRRLLLPTVTYSCLHCLLAWENGPPHCHRAWGGRGQGTSTKPGSLFGRRKMVMCVNECWIISNVFCCNTKQTLK